MECGNTVLVMRQYFRGCKPNSDRTKDFLTQPSSQFHSSTDSPFRDISLTRSRIVFRRIPSLTMKILPPPLPDALVTFNVRSRTFQTTLTTLRRFPGSVLYKMIE